MARRVGPRIDLSLAPRLRLAVLLLAALGGAVWAVARPERLWFPRRLPESPERIASARELIDPNTASVPSLRRLPDVGILRARDIVAWRQTHGPVAFRTLADLDAVYNIGPATLRHIAPHLSLPAETERGR
ncbi:MAG: hypothetical protein GVY16_02765 [Planctomycetes bacterium]|jgi:hypothetical protein|nr:helix-hairpin-helix domain-containing protein [Phycisphaerae bacterium]NBB94641.1 hypothetical protein [Planctomycetota bacterium]